MSEQEKFVKENETKRASLAASYKPTECLPHSNSRERNAVLGQTEDLVRLADRLQILREKMTNDLTPREHEHRCGDCDQLPHTTFDRIIVNNHHINCLTEFVDDLINRFQP